VGMPAERETSNKSSIVATDKACAYAGRMGVVESMVSSCYGELACDGLGSKVRVGTLNKACVGY
jgi:hypothetical protein